LQFVLFNVDLVFDLVFVVAMRTTESGTNVVRLAAGTNVVWLATVLVFVSLDWRLSDGCNTVQVDNN
jgi:hypothetical protein